VTSGEPSGADHLKSNRHAVILEAALCLMVVAGVVHTISFFARWGYLPQPFLYDVNNTFMDWINTAYWAHHPGAYEVWHSVYPPLSFVFLKVFSRGRCYVDDVSIASASCDWIAQAAILTIYVLNLFIIYRCYRLADRRTAILRTVALSLSLPMLFSVERGNMIVLCLTFFMLGHGRLLKSAWLRWLSIGATINFKPYLVFAVIPYLARRRWRWLEGSAIATLFIYLITYAMMGSGSPLELIENQRSWLDVTAADHWWNIYYSTSYTSLLAALQGSYPLLTFIDSRVLEGAIWLLPVLIRTGMLTAALAMLVTWFRPSAATTTRLAALGLSVLLTASNPGGYTEVFLLFLVFLEPWRGGARITALVAAYLLAVPFDHMLIGVIDLHQTSWLGHRQVSTSFGLAVGQFVRPGLLLTIQIALAIGTLLDAWRAREAEHQYILPDSTNTAPERV
jgi:hypothetical protein